MEEKIKDFVERQHNHCILEDGSMENLCFDSWWELEDFVLEMVKARDEELVEKIVMLFKEVEEREDRVEVGDVIKLIKNNEIL